MRLLIDESKFHDDKKKKKEKFKKILKNLKANKIQIFKTICDQLNGFPIPSTESYCDPLLIRKILNIT